MKYNLEELLKENMNIQETPSQELKERILYQEEEGISMRDKRKLLKFVPKVAAAHNQGFQGSRQQGGEHSRRQKFAADNSGR